MQKLSKKVCFVTGAASGIGAALARHMALQGAAVALSDIHESGAQQVAADITAGGGRAIAIKTDASSPPAMLSAMQVTANSFGSLDVVFNNAGIPAACALDDITPDIFSEVMRVNAYSVVAGCQAAAKFMRGQHSGSIINTCSVAGKRGFPGHAVYSASKFAVRAFTQAFAQELAADGIRVNAICPGMIHTPLWEEVSSQQSKRYGAIDAATLVKNYSAGAALGRAGTPEDLMGVAVFLASSDSAYMTGQSINIDGGIVYE
jgi:meso-butanediol dehydrogenase / (S,S)-butanediol dehydrogenase / diacetyl reductase